MSALQPCAEAATALMPGLLHKSEKRYPQYFGAGPSPGRGRERFSPSLKRYEKRTAEPKAPLSFVFIHTPLCGRVLGFVQKQFRALVCILADKARELSKDNSLV